MQVNSRVPSSAQDGVHVQLTPLVAKHLAAPFLKPYADYNRRAADESLARYARRGAGAPLILDACCGVGESSIALARAFPDHYVIGVDQSADRLARRISEIPFEDFDVHDRFVVEEVTSSGDGHHG